MTYGRILAYLAILGGSLWFGATRAFGAFSGTVKPLSGTPAFGVSLWKPQFLPQGWENAVARLDFVSIKINDGSSAYTTGEKGQELAETYTRIRQLGVATHGWGWHYLDTTTDKAIQEARSAIEACRHFKLKTYYVNAEHNWTKSANPVATMTTLVQTFRTEAPDIKLVYNSSVGPGGAPTLAPQVIHLFDVYAPMVYATTRERCAEEWRDRHAEAVKAGVPYSPMGGSGRASDHPGRFWSYTYGPLGQIELQRDYPAEWVVPFLGNTAGAHMLVSGNAENPSLPEQAKLLKRASRDLLPLT